jgi:tetratricopeptide (TPR) repeat protein
MRRAPAVLLSIALGLSGGCATSTRVFRCPAHGGPAWRALVSDHFVLRTNLSAADAGALVARFERMRAAVAAALPGAPAMPGRVEVIAFRSGADYASFAPDGARGYYLRSEGGPPRIVMAGGLAASERALLAHELTHHFLAGALKRQPRWFAEGLASYMESLGDDAPTGELVVGAPPPERLSRVRRAPVPVRELLRWDGTAPSRDASLARYASSWLLVHWLTHERPVALAALGARLAEGDAPADAWRVALPDCDPDLPGALERLDAELARYARGELAIRRQTVEVPAAVGYFESPVPAAEVHAIRLALWGIGPSKGKPQLRAEVQDALGDDPGHPIALRYKAALDGFGALRLARGSVAAHPDDPRAWTFLAEALEGWPGTGDEREAAYRRAAELAPENPATLFNLAIQLLASGRSGEALPHARRAAELAPWSPPILAGYAAVLSDLGQCAAAIAVQQHASDALPETATGEARRAFAEQLDGYAHQCRAAAEARARAPTLGP